jgi:isopentenyl phosphate kinase
VGEGGAVLRGDEVVVTVAATLDAARVGLCSTVPGVLDDDGSVVERIESYDQVASVLGGSDATDVSGGMAGKIRQLLELDAPASVFDLDGLEPFFASGKAGTVVDG